MEKEISNSEIVGNLRKASRLFKTFEKAGDMAEMFCDYEGKVARLKLDVTSLTDEKEKLNFECDQVVEKIDKAKLVFETLESENEARISKAKLDADKIIRESQGIAKATTDTANNEVELINARIESLKAEKVSHETSTTKALSELKKVEKQVSDFKKKFAQS